MVHTIGIMGAPKKSEIQERDLHDFKHFKLLLPMLAKLHDNGCGRDRAGRRSLLLRARIGDAAGTLADDDIKGFSREFEEFLTNCGFEIRR